MKNNPIRILLVDDHFVVRMGLAAILNLNPELKVIADAEDGAHALELFRQHNPDVALVDVRMPGMSGVETTAAIRKEFPDARLIMLSTYDGDEDIYRALQAGARGYLLKSISGEELIKAIKTVHAGEQYLPQRVAERLSERNPGSDLTARELEVLQLMSKGLSKKEIGEIIGISENTVKNHVKSILHKLDVNDRTEAITASIERGILHLE